MKIPTEWLTQRVENRPMAQHRELAPMAALRIRREWEKLKARGGERDELWAFANPANTWKRLGRQTGYALVREGEIVESVVVTRE
jgi:hypothetical protein